MIRITIALSEDVWRKLRDLAEDQRVTGKASVSGVIRGFIEKGLDDSSVPTSHVS